MFLAKSVQDLHPHSYAPLETVAYAPGSLPTTAHYPSDNRVINRIQYFTISDTVNRFKMHQLRNTWCNGAYELNYTIKDGIETNRYTRPSTQNIIRIATCPGV
jgi:hypothetical protein